MLDVLRNKAYRKLFGAQLVALVGTGLLTVALGLLAFDIAGGDAGLVLGAALTIKMLAYVGVAPIIAALTGRVPRKVLLIGSDIVRAGVAFSLPFVSEVWQIFVLIFVLQAASATFTPALQAVIPDVLPEEKQYTRALSLTRLAYDLESLASPILATVLLTVIGYHDLFVGTAIGFVASAALVLATALPRFAPADPAPFTERLGRGTRVFWRTPALRGLSALNLVVASSTAMVLVNSILLAQDFFERGESDFALLLAAFGSGSMLAALVLPKMLDTLPDRRVMLSGAALLPVGLIVTAALSIAPPTTASWIGIIIVWGVLGAATALVLTPSARLMRRHSDSSSRPSVFAAQFSLSHACYLVTYPAAGALGALLGLPAAALFLALVGVLAWFTARQLWPPSNRARAETLNAARIPGGVDGIRCADRE